MSGTEQGPDQILSGPFSLLGQNWAISTVFKVLFLNTRSSPHNYPPNPIYLLPDIQYSFLYSYPQTMPHGTTCTP